MKRLLLLFCSLVLLACVPTPVEEFVVNKADGKLEDIIHTTPAPTEPADAGWTMAPDATESPTEPPMAVTHWSDSFSVAAAMDRLDVEINADIAYPFGGTAPVFRIGFSAPEEDAARKIISSLLGDGTLYLADRSKTKAFYKAQMERYIAEKERETEQAHLEQWDTLLDRAAKEYADAPDALQTVRWNGSVTGGVDLMADNGDGTYRYLHADERAITFIDALDAPSFPPNTRKVSFKVKSDEEADAVRFCETVLQSLGIDAAFSGIASTQSSVREFGARVRDGYVVYFEPLYGGLPISSVSHFHGYDDAIEAAGGASEPAYSVPYEAESIQMVVSGTHLVSLHYLRPSRIRAVENEAAALLPLNQIQALFQNDIGKVLFVSKGYPMKLRVHTVRLILQRIPIADRTDELYLMPTWEFVAAVDDNDALQNVYVLHLNALDGSILS